MVLVSCYYMVVIVLLLCAIVSTTSMLEIYLLLLNYLESSRRILELVPKQSATIDSLSKHQW